MLQNDGSSGTSYERGEPGSLMMAQELAAERTPQAGVADAAGEDAVLSRE